MAGRSREMRRGVSTPYHLQSNDEHAQGNRMRHKRHCNSRTALNMPLHRCRPTPNFEVVASTHQLRRASESGPNANRCFSYVILGASQCYLLVAWYHAPIYVVICNYFTIINIITTILLLNEHPWRTSDNPFGMM
jgi:hypothetical protein